jgi:hypothetical protein
MVLWGAVVQTEGQRTLFVSAMKRLMAPAVDDRAEEAAIVPPHGEQIPDGL